MSERKFESHEAVRGDDPLLIALMGPPGGGKSYSALRLAKGMQSVSGGDIEVIDTENRMRKYADYFKFRITPFNPPFKSEDFWTAIKQAAARKPAAIVVDSLSDEHEGDGGYLAWHDQMVEKMGGNEWAAWAKPAASRRILTTNLLRLKIPLIACFRAREKTKQAVNDRGKKEVINIGYQPVAPAEIVHTMDLTCILPPKANGVPVWKSDKIGEDFVLKMPEYLRALIRDGAQIDEEFGAALETWRRGGKMQNEPQIKSGGQSASKPKETLDDRIAAFKAEITKCQFGAEINQVKERRAAFLTWLQENNATAYDAITAFIAEHAAKVE